MTIDGNSNGNRYSKDYLIDINNVLINRIDGNGGKKDGKVTVNEAYKDLNIGSLFLGLKEGSNEYNKLKTLTDTIPEVLKKYAGSDGIFQTEEWADFLNGNEWGAVLDQYHSSKNFAKIEIDLADKSMERFTDEEYTKGEIKVALLNNLQKTYLTSLDTEAIGKRIEAIVDKYAGEDGRFTDAEFTAMKNDPEYKLIAELPRSISFGLD